MIGYRLVIPKNLNFVLPQHEQVIIDDSVGSIKSEFKKENIDFENVQIFGCEFGKNNIIDFCYFN